MVTVEVVSIPLGMVAPRSWLILLVNLFAKSSSIDFGFVVGVLIDLSEGRRKEKSATEAGFEMRLEELVVEGVFVPSLFVGDLLVGPVCWSAE